MGVYVYDSCRQYSVNGKQGYILNFIDLFVQQESCIKKNIKKIFLRQHS